MALDKFIAKGQKTEKQERREEKRRPAERIEERKQVVPKQPEEKSKEGGPTKGIVLDVGYDGQQAKAYLWLYDPKTQEVVKWFDSTGHLPYLLSDIEKQEIQTHFPQVSQHKGFAELVSIKKFDLLRDRPITMTKVVAKDPLSIGGRQGSIRAMLKDHSWEDYIKYHKCYVYDRQIVLGMPYEIVGDRLNPVHPEIPAATKTQIIELFKAESEDYLLALEQYLGYFFSPIPEIKRVAFDIEVFSSPSRIPDPNKGEEKIICVSFRGTDGLKRVLVLKRNDVEVGEKDSGLDTEIEIFNSETELIQETFRILEKYPIVLTFNGDNFDLKYILNRCLKHLHFRKDDVPIFMTVTPQSEIAHLKNSIHIDLYKFFHNRAIKVSAFRNLYDDVSLNTVGKTFLNLAKLPLSKSISELTLHELAHYCIRDSEITLNLTTFNGNLVMNLLIILMRITRLSMEDLTRQGVSTWLQNLFYAEHRSRGFLIPNPEYIQKLKGKASTTAMIKGKKYKGAIVVKPQPGVHFNVTVLDFASLYPSVIKTWNLSYETVDCSHPECRNHMIPETPHWSCTKKIGIMSLIIGLLRDLRVKYFKNAQKDKSLPENVRNLNKIITDSLKILINASYGVFGSEAFPLYCLPVAEATAAIGRFAITETQTKCAELGIEVIYGDTDSVFLKNPTKEQIKSIIDWSDKDLQIELDIDKVYRYLALSERKKNYLGVYSEGNVDVKGLSGKKRNTPQFIQDMFREMVEELSKVKVPEDFEVAKEQIKNKIKTAIKKLENHEYSMEDLAYQMTMSKDPDKYEKAVPQHVQAARLLEKHLNRRISSGDIIQFVKTKTGVLPVELAKNSDVSIKKYKEQIESIFEQVLDAIGIPFDELYGIKVRKLDAFV
jgi:DNA polymerase I